MVMMTSGLLRHGGDSFILDAVFRVQYPRFPGPTSTICLLNCWRYSQYCSHSTAPVRQVTMLFCQMPCLQAPPHQGERHNLYNSPQGTDELQLLGSSAASLPLFLFSPLQPLWPLLFLQPTKYALIPGLLHLLSPLPGTLFPHTCPHGHILMALSRLPNISVMRPSLTIPLKKKS